MLLLLERRRHTLVPRGLLLAIQQFDELLVVLGLGKAVDHQLGGVLDLLAGEGAAQELRAVQIFTGQDELFFAGAGRVEVDRGPQA